MKIKKKIAVWCSLFALMVALVPPSSAKAEVIYSFTEWCEDNGYYINYTVEDNYRYVVYDSGGTVNCIGVHKDSKVYYSDNGIYYSGWFDRLELDNDTNTFKLKVSSNTSSGSAMCYSILYTGRDIYDKTEVDKIVYAPTVKLYTFEKWCADAGLNCEFVDVEGQSVEYAPNDMYVVRRGVSADNVYPYYLTRINIERDGLCFPTLSNGLVGVGTMSDEWQAYSVYQYEYDYTLGCWCATDNFVTQEVVNGSPSSGLNCALGNGKGLVYSNRDLYSGDFSIAYAESTEFVSEPFYGGVNDVVSPTPTPEVPSGGGSGSSNGFDIVTYSSQIKAEVKADSVNMRNKPSLEGSVVASFIKTWNVDVLGYVYADDGAVWYYCKTVRDDMEYIGFIKAEYLTVLSVENNDFNIDFGDIDLEDSPELIATAKNSFIELLGFVGVVPMMIGVVFGFLPSWCLGVVGVSVVVLCFLAIIKRG